MKRTLPLILALAAGCRAPAPAPAPRPPPVPTITFQPLTTLRALGVTPGPLVVVHQSLSFYLPSFSYPTNACDYTWHLQGSSNLLDWVDLASVFGLITNFAPGCPLTNSTFDVPLRPPPYFYRLKGKLTL